MAEKSSSQILAPTQMMKNTKILLFSKRLNILFSCICEKKSIRMVYSKSVKRWKTNKLFPHIDMIKNKDKSVKNETAI